MRVRVPAVEEIFGVLMSHLQDTPPLGSRETSSIDQLHRGKPQLRVSVSFLHMDMRRLVTFTTKEKIAEAFGPQKRWHGV
jgi:hypothetical protein